MGSNILIITGPSGFEKYKLIDAAILKNKNLIKSLSYTDKPKDENDLDNTNFHYVSEDEFSKMIDNEEFIEWQRLLSNNYRYGKPKKEFAELLEKNPDKIIITVINIINLPIFKRFYPESKSIFVDVKDTKALIEILRNSPDVTTEEEFQRRFKFATEERRRRHLTDYNMNMSDDFESSLQQFLSIIDKAFSK